jgi:hypothetical protein
MKGHISEMSEDILDQVIAELKATAYFTLQSDKSTDVASSEELHAYYEKSLELSLVHFYFIQKFASYCM